MARSYQPRPWEREYTTPTPEGGNYGIPAPGETVYPQPLGEIGMQPYIPSYPWQVAPPYRPGLPAPVSYENLGKLPFPSPPGLGPKTYLPPQPNPPQQPWQQGRQGGQGGWWQNWYQQRLQRRQQEEAEQEARRQQMLQRRQGYAAGGGQLIGYGGQPWQGGPLAPTGTPPPGMGWQ